MSWQIAGWVLKQRLSVPGAHHVLLVLATFADKSGVAWPSQQMLADVTGQSLDSIQRHCQWLEEQGLISVEKRQGRGNYYKFPMTKPHLAVSGGRIVRPVKPQGAAGRKLRSVVAAPRGPSLAANTSRLAANTSDDQPQIPVEQTALSASANSHSSKNTSQHTSIDTSLSEASGGDASGATSDTANFDGSFVRFGGANEPSKDTAKKAPRPSYADLAAKYPDLLRPKLKRMPTDDHPIDQRWQATPEPSTALVRIELAKKLQRAVSDAEVEQYIAQRKANP